MAACDACLRRTWLLERLSGYLEFQRRRVEVILSFEDQMLIDCWLDVAERKGWSQNVRAEYERYGAADAEACRQAAAGAGIEQICLCENTYPERLRRLYSAPAVIHVAGGMQRFLDLVECDPVAIVGTRRPSVYGTEVARLLGRGVSVSGLSVISGMAMGVDASAHRGALAGGGKTIAVLPGSAAEPYPRTNRQLHSQILRSGVAVSELGPGAPVRKWSLIARNRIVAALAEMTVVVQGRSGSGALITAEFAKEMRRRVGAVPGSVLSSQSEGPHELLRGGAILIRDAQDVLDAICGVGECRVLDPARSGLGDAQLAVLQAICGGADTMAALQREKVGGGALLMLLAELELAGAVRRTTGGRYLAAV